MNLLFSVNKKRKTHLILQKFIYILDLEIFIQAGR